MARLRAGGAWILAAALPFVAGVAQAQTESDGRKVFLEAGCTVCHAYVAKIGAPSAKQMKKAFRGDPAGIQKGIANAPTHQTDPSVKGADKDQIRRVTEWLSGAWSGAAVAVLPPPPPPPETAGEKKARLLAEARAKREAEAQARLARAEAARKDADALAAQKREADERNKKAADERANLKRDADEKARLAAESKARRDAEIQARQKKEAEDLARREADAKARNDVEAQARLKREVEEKARLAAAEKEKAEAEERAAKQQAAEELAKREAELKARREAEEKAAQKRDAEERARREVELARREAEAKARREAEAAAKAAPPVTVALAKPARGALKIDKFRDEPCPPSSGAAIVPDEAKAKAIMDRIDCGGCHAYVQKKTGPPFKRVFEKVKGNPECVVERLKKNQEHIDEGVTGEFKGHEFKIVADYLATRAK